MATKWRFLAAFEGKFSKECNKKSARKLTGPQKFRENARTSFPLTELSRVKIMNNFAFQSSKKIKTNL